MKFAVRNRSNLLLHYFLKIKYTANIKKPNPIAWFNLKLSFLKNTIVKTVNTVNVITSWITFNCQSVNGPPFSTKPILLAGTWKEYSNSAIPQLINITPARLKPLNQVHCLNFKWPYQAKVIKVLDNIKRPIVIKAFFIGIIIRFYIVHQTSYIVLSVSFHYIFSKQCASSYFLLCPK